jgi:hypothetical protein
MRRAGADRAYVCPLLASRGGDISGWPVALYGEMVRAGVISPASVTIELRGAAGKSPFLRCLVPTGRYSAFKAWTVDAALEVQVPKHPRMWALLVPATDDFLEANERVRRAKDTLEDVKAWGLPERVVVGSDADYLRVDFEVPLSWEPPATVIDLGDGVEVRIAAPTEPADVERLKWHRPSATSETPAAPPTPTDNTAEEEARTRKRLRTDTDDDDEFPALRQAGPPPLRPGSALHQPPRPAPASMTTPRATPARGGTPSVGSSATAAPSRPSMAFSASSARSSEPTPRSVHRGGPPPLPPSRARLPLPSAASAAASAAAEGETDNPPPVIRVYPARRGHPEKWYGVKNGKDGPSVYPAYGQVVGSGGAILKGFPTKQGAIDFLVEACRIAPEDVRIERADTEYPFDPPAGRTTAPQAPDEGRNPFFGEGAIFG